MMGWFLSGRVFVREGLCPGGFLSGWLLSGWFLSGGGFCPYTARAAGSSAAGPETSVQQQVPAGTVISDLETSRLPSHSGNTGRSVVWRRYRRRGDFMQPSGPEGHDPAIDEQARETSEASEQD